MSANLTAGRHASMVLKNLKGLPNQAKAAQPVIAAELAKAGFVVKTEVGVSYWGRFKGRVNIVAELAGGKVAIEIDNLSPRTRSVAKLNAMAAYRIVTLRGAFEHLPLGIDEVVTLSAY